MLWKVSTVSTQNIKGLTMAVLHFLNILKQDTYLMFFILCLFCSYSVSKQKSRKLNKIMSQKFLLTEVGYRVPVPSQTHETFLIGIHV